MNVRIQIRNIDFYVPSQMFDGGQVYFDLPDKFQFGFTKSKAEVALLDSIDIAPTISINFPATNKNSYLFRRKKIFEVDVWLGMHVYELHQIELQEDTDNFKCVLKRSNDHWLYIIENTLLKDIPYGNFTYSEFNFSRPDLNKDTYEDGDSGYYHPIADYGTLSSADTILLSNTRPLISPLKLIREGFCSKGWKFRCPFLETSRGRSIWTYDWADGFINNDAFANQFEFKVRTTDNPDNIAKLNGNLPWIVNGELNGFDFENEIYDYPNEFDFNKYTGNYGTVTFTVQGSIKVQKNQNQQGNFGLEVIIFELSPQLGFNVVMQETYYFDNDGEYKINSISEAIELKQGAYYGVYFNMGNFKVLNLDLIWFNEVINIPIKDGTVVPYASTIDQEATLKDYLSGIAHIMDGMFDVDNNKKEIWLYSPFDAYIGANKQQPIEGYYIEEAIEIDNVQCNSELTKSQTDESERYEVIKFKDPEDSYTKSKNFNKNNEPGSRIIDRGYSKEKYKYKENPFFEITLNREYTFISRKLDDFWQTSDQPAILPAMWDNEDGKLSMKIGHRIFIGCFSKQNKNGHDIRIAVDIQGLSMFDYPMIYQFYDFIIVDSRVTDLQLIFGTHEMDLWNTFMKRNYFLQGDFLSLLVFRPDSKVISESFRKFYFYYLKGLPTNLVLDKINNHIFDSGISTPYEFYIRKGKNLVCTNQVSSNCANYPILIVNRVGSSNCYNISISGNYASEIEGNVIFEYYERNEDGSYSSNPISIPNTTNISAQVCGISTRVRIKAHITWEPDENDVQCSAITLSKDIDACSDNNPQLTYELTYQEDQYCIVVNVGGQIIDEYSIISFTYTYNGVTENYTPGSQICGIITSIEFNAEISFDNNDCENRELELIVTVPPVYVDCGNITASVQCEEVSAGCVTFVRTGYLPSAAVTDVIEYQCSIDGVTWDQEIQRWDGEEICCPFVRIRRIINFCNDLCPMYCTGWIYCNGGNCECDFQIVCDTGNAEAHLNIISGCGIGYVFNWYDPNMNLIATGQNYNFTESGIYTVVADNGTCETIRTYEYTKPNAGEPINEPIIVN